VARIGNDFQFRFRPGTMQIPGTLEGTHNVITALNDYRRDVTNLIDVFDLLRFSLEASVIHKVMTLNAREGERESRVAILLGGVLIHKKF
jgi:hypothetical protein